MKIHFCASACIVDNKENKVLFIHHKKLNKWLFVGGHIENNEDPETAVKREVKEETNLDIELLGERYPRETDYIKPFALQRNEVSDDHIHIDIFYVALVKDKNILKSKEDEVLNYRWFSENEILNDDIDTFVEKKQMAIDALRFAKKYEHNSETVK